MLRHFVGCCYADDFSTRLVAVVLGGEVFWNGEHFAELLTSVSLQDDSVTMLTFNHVDVAKDSDPAERSVADEISMDAVIAVCRGGVFQGESFTVDFDRTVGDLDPDGGDG